MLVVDASALVLAATSRTADASALRGRLGSQTVHAPYLLDAEVGSVLRRKVLRGELPASTGQSLHDAAAGLVDVRHDLMPLAPLAWRLLRNVTYYDALYVALAAALEVPLVTSDHRLAAAPGLPCTVEVV